MKTIEHFDGMFFAVERHKDGRPLAYSAKDVTLADAVKSHPGVPLAQSAADYLCANPHEADAVARAAG